MVVRQIGAARALDGTAGVHYGGVALFRGGAITPEMAKALRDGPFATPARLPWQKPAP